MAWCACECPRHAIAAKINTSINKCSTGVEFVLLTPAQVMSVCCGLKTSKVGNKHFLNTNPREFTCTHVHMTLTSEYNASYMFVFACILYPLLPI